MHPYLPFAALRLAGCGVLLGLLLALCVWPLPAAAQPALPDPSGDPASAITRDEVFRIPTGSGKVALTFDGGEWPGPISTILATLARHHVKATFFLCGIYIDSFPSQTRAIARAGEEIASHSYHNEDDRSLSNRQIIDEMRAQEAALLRWTGLYNAPYWRPPYGYRNDRVVQQVNRLGYKSVMWSLDSLDTVAPAKSASYIFNRLTNHPRRDLDGAIIMVHVNPTGTVAALDRVLTYFESVGLHEVTVGQLLGNTP
jgi:peptidoglycan/xylan/chitin deacetylase (PgdA/CDA1 family)